MAARVLGTESYDYRMKYEEETELRLGLPGGRSGNNNNTTTATATTTATTTAIATATAKRGFSETVDLKLKLASKDSSSLDQPQHLNLKDNNINAVPRPSTDLAKSPAKAQVVGWPPVRSFRKNILCVQKNSNQDGAKSADSTSAAAFVKVSMDGAPYLRKVDLKMYKSYKELSVALAKMFSSFTIGNCGGSQGMKDLMSESKLRDLLNGSDYVPTYEDKDGDWMLVGDVPWEMFVNSCKRLRIMKGSEAIGLAPRALEKCKNRS